MVDVKRLYLTEKVGQIIQCDCYSCCSQCCHWEHCRIHLDPPCWAMDP